MEEHFLRVQRTARYHSIGEPSRASSIWIVVHGYGQLARFFLNGFNASMAGRYIVAPEGLSRFYLDPEHSRVGATWMTREDRMNEIHDHVEFLDALVSHVRLKCPPGVPVNALGFSQGVATVSRWSIKGKSPLQRIVLWAGGIPPELDTATLHAWQDKHIDLVLGSDDPYAKASDLDAMAQRLITARVPHKAHLFEGEHRLEPVLLEKLMSRA
jgi:predicted esterase